MINENENILIFAFKFLQFLYIFSQLNGTLCDFRLTDAVAVAVAVLLVFMLV